MNYEANDLDLSFMKNILNKYLTKEQKYTIHLIKQKNKVLDQLRQLKDAGFELYLMEFNPNNTNDLLITKDSKIIESIPEFTFGLSTVNPDRQYQNCKHLYNNYIEYLNEAHELDVENNYYRYVKIFNPFTMVEALALSSVNPEYNYQVNALGTFLAATK